jgi:hypothetical protein
MSRQEKRHMTTTTQETPEQTMARLDSELEQPVKRHMLSIADITGDTRIMWDPRNSDEVKIAKAAFDSAKKRKMLAYSVDENGGKTGEVIREFDPQLGKIIMTKQLAGG